MRVDPCRATLANAHFGKVTSRQSSSRPVARWGRRLLSAKTSAGRCPCRQAKGFLDDGLHLQQDVEKAMWKSKSTTPRNNLRVAGWPQLHSPSKAQRKKWQAAPCRRSNGGRNIAIASITIPSLSRTIDVKRLNFNDSTDAVFNCSADCLAPHACQMR